MCVCVCVCVCLARDPDFRSPPGDDFYLHSADPQPPVAHTLVVAHWDTPEQRAV